MFVGLKRGGFWLRGVDLNHRPLGYEPNELPDCSTPRFHDSNLSGERSNAWAHSCSAVLMSRGSRGSAFCGSWSVEGAGLEDGSDFDGDSVARQNRAFAESRQLTAQTGDGPGMEL